MHIERISPFFVIGPIVWGRHNKAQESMTKQELIDAFVKNHQELIDFVNALTDEEFTFSYDAKWTAGQQLSHAYLCLLPLPKSLALKEHILQKFGKIDRPTWDYDTVMEHYMKTSRKAPERFLPEPIGPEQKTKLTADFQEILSTIQQALNGLTDEELDTFVLPHPLLGNLTIREMFYLMTYHPIHHLKQTQQGLNYKRK